MDDAKNNNDGENKDNGENIFEEAKKQFGDKVNGLKDLTWERLPETARDHIKRHPNLTAIQLILIIFTLAPGLIVAPALGALGFTSIGPVAGSAAAAFQSANGATGLFSALQSAAMGGYAAAAVNGVAQAVTSIGVDVVQWFKGE